jgi:hypothetical protein
MKTNVLNTRLYFAIVLFASLLFFSCSPKTYTSASFKENTPKSIAILPYTVKFSGKKPKSLTDEQLLKQDQEERLGFQNSLFSYLSGKLKKEPVKIFAIQQTNSKLSDAGIDIYNIEKYQPEELAKILNVDAIICPSVEKFRYRSDEASMIADIVGAGVAIASKGQLGLPYGLSSTNEVKANCALLSGKDGSLLWNVGRIGTAQWNYPVINVMDDLHRRMARRLPDFGK